MALVRVATASRYLPASNAACMVSMASERGLPAGITASKTDTNVIETSIFVQQPKQPFLREARRSPAWQLRRFLLFLSEFHNPWHWMRPLPPPASAGGTDRRLKRSACCRRFEPPHAAESAYLAAALYASAPSHLCWATAHSGH